jgi:hypothetical protein
MIECLFTIDYEIYGNGTGGLRDLVYEPSRKLVEVFTKHGVRFVPFVEVAEFARIEAQGTDGAIELVKEQIKDFHRDGFELGLHLHPQWHRARYQDGRWHLDYRLYNLCTLPRQEIEEIVDEALEYLRMILGEPSFVPLSFRAGNWLFQPTATAAAVLRQKGIQLDSSVFKGGRQRNHRLDYRPARRNGYFWQFGANVNVAERDGAMVEVPIFSEMVPFWRMCTGKRVGLQAKGGFASPTFPQRVRRCLDFCRLRYPMKFDFCRMTLSEMTRMFDRVIAADRRDPHTYKPIVAIGHSKDLVDFEAIANFLDYLDQRGIKVCTFKTVLERVLPKSAHSAAPAQHAHH